MAKSVKKENTKSTDSKEIKSLKMKRQYKVVLGCLLCLFSIGLLIAFVSFFIHGQSDQSVVNEVADRTKPATNWLGKFGAYLADFFIFKGFGAASFLFVKLFFITGAFLILELPLKKLKTTWFWDLFGVIILSILFGFFANSIPELGGTIGYEMNLFFQDYIGKIGTFLVLVFGLIIYLLFKIKLSPDTIKTFFEKRKSEMNAHLDDLKSEKLDSSYNLEEYAVDETKDDL
uniref:DNA translocase FtsK 4TM domain-containing protein n=1 Tax=Flavobacterium sp. TaxID=239 RepID=UPI003751BE3B